MNILHRQLKVFLLVARLHNFSRAAEQLFIAKSGLSTMVRELEEQFGFRLFDRTTRHVRLTEFGTQFLPIAEQNVQSIEGIVSRIGEIARQARVQPTYM
ncbi:MAG: LysR family transcriptional regulator [Candidatus Protistobacter heckmanni]|nr:LysR family transcriptional regulator [Candidatus Protistobacter heckmanni]